MKKNTRFSMMWVLTIVLYSGMVQSIYAVDLSFVSIQFDNSTNPTQFYFTENTGINPSGSAVAPHHYDAFYLSKDTTFDPSDSLLQSYYLYSTPESFQSGTIYLTSSNLPAGKYYIIAVADINGEVTETNEGNNVFVSSSFQVLKQFNADFAVSLGTISQPYYPGDNFSVSYAVSNLGTTVSPDAPLTFYLSKDSMYDNSDVLIRTISTTALQPNKSIASSIYLTIPQTTPPGSYKLLIVADPANQYAEINEQNNVASTPLTILPPNVDLVVLHPSVSSGSVVAGSVFQVSADVKNTGTGTSIPTTLTIDLSDGNTSADYSIGSVDIPALGPGQTYHASALVSSYSYTPGGNYQVIFIEDLYNQQVEINESNNTASKKIHLITATKDLTVHQLFLSTNNVLPGDSVELSFAVKNSGNSMVDETPVALFLSSDKTYSADDYALGTLWFDTIGPKSSVNGVMEGVIPQDVAPGKYFLILYVDNPDLNTEVNENNNTAFVAIHVHATAASQRQAVAFAATPTTAEDFSMTAYKDPAADVVHVLLSNVPSDLSNSPVISNMKGEKIVVTGQSQQENELLIQTSHLSPGIYLIKMQSASKTAAAKFVVE